MYTNFIFDMGNVLMDFNPDYILSRYTDNLEAIETLKAQIFTSPLWKQLDNGDLSFEDAKQAIVQTLPPEYLEMGMSVLDTWQTHKLPRHDMTQIIKELKAKGYGIYLCSNAAQRFYTYKDRFEVFQYFDDLVISADIQISKPSPGIYEHVLKKNQLDPSTCLFIDDIQENIVGAKACGIAGYHFNGNTEMFKAYLSAIHVL